MEKADRWLGPPGAREAWSGVADDGVVWRQWAREAAAAAVGKGGRGGGGGDGGDELGAAGAVGKGGRGSCGKGSCSGGDELRAAAAVKGKGLGDRGQEARRGVVLLVGGEHEAVIRWGALRMESGEGKNPTGGWRPFLRF